MSNSVVAIVTYTSPLFVGTATCNVKVPEGTSDFDIKMKIIQIIKDEYDTNGWTHEQIVPNMFTIWNIDFRKY